MKKGSSSTFGFETGEGPGRGNIEVAVHTERSERGPKIGWLRSTTNADPNTSMEVSGIATGSLDLHVLAEFLSKQMPMISGEDNRGDAQIAEDTDTTSQVIEYAVHLTASLCDVVLLTEFVNFLGCDQYQLGVLNPIADFL